MESKQQTIRDAMKFWDPEGRWRAIVHHHHGVIAISYIHPQRIHSTHISSRDICSEPFICASLLIRVLHDPQPHHHGLVGARGEQLREEKTSGLDLMCHNDTSNKS